MTALALEGGGDYVFLDLAIENNLQQVGFATDLAIFHILLRGPAAVVDGDVVPLTAARALEA